MIARGGAQVALDERTEVKEQLGASTATVGGTMLMPGPTSGACSTTDVTNSATTSPTGLHFQPIASTASRPRHEVPPELAHIPKANVFPQRRYAWNSQQEIVSLLLGAADHDDWISKEVQVRPPNGSMILYRKPVSVLARSKDGYTWKKKLKRRTVRESHIFLKINGVECILANYAHSAILATFHRRTYFLCHNSDIVLFHYLNVPPLTPEDKLCIPLPTLTPTDLEAIDRGRLIEQLKPMFDTFPTRITRSDRREILHFDVPSVMRAIFEAVLSQKEGRSLPSVSPDACFVFSVCSTSAVQYVSPRQPTAGSVLRIVQHRPPPPSALQQHSRNPGATPAAAAAVKACSPTSLIKIIDPPPQAPQTFKDPSTFQLNPVSTQSSVPQQQTKQLTQEQQQQQQKQQQHTSSIHMTAPSPAQSQASTADSAPKLRSLLFAESPPTSINGPPSSSTCLSGENSVQQSSAVAEDHSVDNFVQDQGHPTHEVNSLIATNETFSANGSDLLCTFPSFQDDSSATMSGRLAMDPTSLDDQSPANRENELDFLPEIDFSDVIGAADEWSDDVLNELLDGTPCPSSSVIPTATPCDPMADVGAFDAASQPHLSSREADAHCYEKRQAQGQLERSDCPSPVDDASMDALVEIKHCAPDWAYAEGGCRMLLTGPWYSSRSPYSCIFDTLEVPAMLVQTGVLACTVPKFDYTGEVRLRVACEGRIISRPHAFHVREGPATTLHQGMSEESVFLASRSNLHVPHHPGCPPLVKTASADAADECDVRWFMQFSVAQLKLIIMDKMDCLEASLPPARIDDPVKETLTPSEVICPESCADTLEWILCRSCQQWSATGQQTSGRAVTIAPGIGVGQPNALNQSYCVVSSTNMATTLAAESSGLSLLHAAAGLGYTELIRILLMWREKVNPDMLLLKHDVDGLRVDGRGCTPLMWACARGHAKTAQILAHNDLDALRLKNNCGLLPVQVAEKLGHYDVVRMFSRLACGSGTPRLARSSSLDSPAGAPSICASTPTGAGMAQPVMAHELMDLSFQSSTEEEEEELFGCVTSDEESSAQMVCLAGRIIQAMPRRIKLSPNPAASNPLPNPVPLDAGVLVASGESPAAATTVAPAPVTATTTGALSSLTRRNRSGSSQSSSYSSLNSDQSILSACGPTLPPPMDDSGISTPFDEYRYGGSVGTGGVDTPSSSLSPAGCGGIASGTGGADSLASPYTFSLDSPPPTTAEIAEHFNASATFMEKDFSRLTLSDLEQKRLYEAAKVIQNCYRQYKRKQRNIDGEALPVCGPAVPVGHVDQACGVPASEEPQKEIEAATIIQSYYRRYKQYAYYKRMYQAAVLIQNQFRSYVEHKRAGAGSSSGLPARIKTNERFKRNKHSPVLVNQKFRNHYQRKGAGTGHMVTQAVSSSVSNTASLSAAYGLLRNMLLSAGGEERLFNATTGSSAGGESGCGSVRGRFGSQLSSASDTLTGAPQAPSSSL